MTSATRSGGVFASLRGLAETLLSSAATRFELLGLEVAEEKERLLALLITAIAMVFAFAFAVLMLSLLIVALFWDNRLAAVAGCALFYAALGVWLWSQLRAQLAAHPPVFSATMAELNKDRDALRATLTHPPGVPPSP